MDKPKEPAVALEKKLHGAWKTDLDCVGDLTIRADGTFDRQHYSPRNNKLAGTWEVQWNALPPTLVLSCKDSDDSDYVGMTTEFKLIHLDDETLAFQNPGGSAIRFTRMEGPEILERKLHGTWQGPPCGGDWTYRTDGTFEVKHFTPGNNTLTGSWKVRWNTLPQ